ncbi:MAG: hypothetical protein ACYC6C_13525, partial [Coriobacteriia bacterium]
MSLREAAEILTPKPTGIPCGVTKLAASLPDDDRQWLEGALESDARSSWIAEVLHAEGFDISQNMVSRHRRRG